MADERRQGAELQARDGRAAIINGAGAATRDSGRAASMCDKDATGIQRLLARARTRTIFATTKGTFCCNHRCVLLP